jgi:hypothetical protein
VISNPLLNGLVLGATNEPTLRHFEHGRYSRHIYYLGALLPYRPSSAHLRRQLESKSVRFLDNKSQMSRISCTFEQRSDVEQVRSWPGSYSAPETLLALKKRSPTVPGGRGNHSVHDGRIASVILIFAKLRPATRSGRLGNRIDGNETLGLLSEGDDR